MNANISANANAYRQSAASSRASTLHGSQNPSPAAITRLLEKKKELEAVSALERTSAVFLKRIESLAEDCETMAEAGLVHGQVLSQWPQMFRLLNMFLASRETSADTTEEDHSEGFVGERLVRLPVEDLRPAEG